MKDEDVLVSKLTILHICLQKILVFFCQSWKYCEFSGKLYSNQILFKRLRYFELVFRCDVKLAYLVIVLVRISCCEWRKLTTVESWLKHFEHSFYCAHLGAEFGEKRTKVLKKLRIVSTFKWIKLEFIIPSKFKLLAIPM